MDRGITLKEIIKSLEKKYPTHLAESWDNVGLLVGEQSKVVKKIQLSLDISDNVIENAIKNRVDLIITHHPMIFSPISKITDKDSTGKRIIELIKNNIAVYTLHTNLDSAKDGLNAFLMEKLTGSKGKILSEIKEKLYKLSIYVPEDSFEEIRAKVLEYNDFVKGNYDMNSYSAKYIETYRPLCGAKPKFGEVGKVSEIAVYKLEIVSTKQKVNTVLSKIKKYHPYEEPAFEIVELSQTILSGGIGRVVNLKERVKISDYIEQIKNVYNLDFVRAVYKEDKMVKKIGLVNGSGASYIKTMARAGVELFITADVKYHEAMDLLDTNMAIVDIGHFEVEHYFAELLMRDIVESVEKIIFHEGAIFKVL